MFSSEVNGHLGHFLGCCQTAIHGHFGLIEKVYILKVGEEFFSISFPLNRVFVSFSASVIAILCLLSFSRILSNKQKEHNWKHAQDTAKPRVI